MKLIAAWIALLLQAVPSAQLPSEPSRASIEGIVRRIGSDEPIAGAQLTLTGASGFTLAKPVPPVTTDSAGRFSIKDLDAGSYKLVALSNGYARQEYGQRKAGMPGAAIVLTEGQTLRDIAIHLTPAGSVSGHVRNPNGRALAVVAIQLVRWEYNLSGQRTLSVAQSARTDDRGEYRFYWTTPGQYYVVAGNGPAPRGILADRDGEVNNQNEVLDRYPYTFFPGSSEVEKAEIINVSPGNERQDIDFTLPLSRQYGMRGRVTDSATGVAPPQAVVTLSYSTPTGRSAISSTGYYTAQTGIIDLGELPPGGYSISVTAFDGPGIPTRAIGRSAPGPSAAVDVVISNSDIDLGVLALAAPHVVNGRVKIEGTFPAAIESIQVSLIALTDNRAPTTVAFPKADGSLTVNFPYTALRVAALNLPPGFYVREARLDGTDALAGPAPVARTSELEVVLSSKAGQVEGIVRNERSQPLAGVQAVLIPDVARNHPELYKEAISDQNGRFAISSITPGSYKIFAWEGLAQRYSYFDPDVLRQHEQKGQAVQVAESSRLTVDVKIIPAREE